MAASRPGHRNVPGTTVGHRNVPGTTVGHCNVPRTTVARVLRRRAYGTMGVVKISRFADDSLTVPPVIAQLGAGSSISAVWTNGDGGVTFRISSEVGPGRFVKWAPAGSPDNLAAEMTRLTWAAKFARVPQVLDFAETPAGAYLLTAALPGDNAITDRWKADPARAVHAAGSGLRALHDALPLDDCPFDWSIASRLAPTPADARDQLPPPPMTDQLVVCHGDACVPNTLIDPAGKFVGHVDLGSLGRGDRWADLAVATWSTEWNYGPGWELSLLSAYGIEPDPQRTSYYRALWNIETPV